VNPPDASPADLVSALEGFDLLCDSSAVPMAIVELRPDTTTVLRANAAMERLFGVPTLTGRALGDFTDPDELLSDVPIRTRIIDGDANFYGREKRYQRPDGVLIDVQVFGVALRGDGGRRFALGVFAHAPEWLRRGFRTQSHLAMALADVRAALLSGDAEDAVLELICRSACRLLDIDHAGVLMLEDPDTLRTAAVDRGPDDAAVGQRHPVESAEYGPVIKARRTHQYEVPAGVLTQYSNDLPESVDRARSLFIALAPMLSAGRTLGALAVRRYSGPYEHLELEVLETFAQEVGESFALAELRTDRERLSVVETREQIARNLHDEVTQDLIGVRLGLVHLVPRVADPDLRADLDRCLRDLDDATRRLRDVVAGLDGTTSAEDFVDVLRSITGSKAARVQIDWNVAVVGGVARLRDDERAELLRVVNEAVSNVVRHARASRVDVELAVLDDEVVVTVDDDGIGLGSPSGRRSGVANLQARADARRGQCDLTARPEGGTRLQWRVPLLQLPPNQSAGPSGP
jgi:PAS domain S-box-containing protein